MTQGGPFLYAYALGFQKRPRVALVLVELLLDRPPRDPPPFPDLQSLNLDAAGRYVVGLGLPFSTWYFTMSTARWRFPGQLWI
jgi:hypothetical protein